MANTENRKSYPRSYRIASLVRRSLSPILARWHAGVTVRRISLNGDFSVATVHYSLLSGDADKVQESLSQNAPMLRKRLASAANMRSTPKLVFAPDDEGMAADKMLDFLDEVSSDPASSA